MAFFMAMVPLLCQGQQAESPLVKSYREHVKHKQETQFGLEWIQLGPTSNSALVEAFQVDLQHPGTMYAGFGSGGLWKTVNNGLTWKPIFEDQPSYAVGDVALAPSNTNIIYLGTGETLKKPRNFTMPGTGMYRSEDGGETWQHIGLSDTWHISKVTVHPTNPDIVYVAAVGHLWSTNSSRGVFRTLNGGKTWEHVLFVNDRTGANDVVVAPSNPHRVYASAWESYPGVSGVNSGIYKSDDDGKTWVKSDAGLPTDAGKGRIGLAVSYQNPDNVYALLDHRDKPKGEGAGPGAAEVYQSLDGGKSWKKTHADELMIFSVIGWYFADIVVDPRNDEEIYALGVRMAHSTDGGKTFELVGGDVYHLFPNPAEPLHLDQCELWINPTNSRHLVLANDGGFYVSYDKGATWMHLNNIPTGEFYDITIDHRNPYTIYAGAQDDATVYGPGREWIPRRYDNWRYLWIDPWSGGDGCITVVDPLDSNTIYYSSQEGGIRRMDLRTRISEKAQVSEEQRKSLRFNFISPYFLSTHSRSLYLGANLVMKSDDQGRTWIAASPDLTEGKDKARKSLAIGAVAESPLKRGLMYAGTDKGLLWVTLDGGSTWKEHSVGLPAAYIRSIAPSRFKESRVYAALSGINYDDFNTYLYKSEDYGKTWDKITGNLPGEVAYVIKEDPVYEDVLYAGLYRSAYISVDRGKQWAQLGIGLPAAAVSDLEMDERSKDLVLSTHGRGIFKLNRHALYEWLADGMKQEERLFSVPAATAPDPEKLPDDSNSMSYEKLPFTFWKNAEGEVTLSLINEQREVVWEKKERVRSGFNQYRWDFVVKKQSSLLPYFVGYTQYVKPGKYILRLSGEPTIETAVEIR